MHAKMLLVATKCLLNSNGRGTFMFVFIVVFGALCTAWTVRLPEILKKQGMAVIVSQVWGVQKLAPLFANRLGSVN